MLSNDLVHRVGDHRALFRDAYGTNRPLIFPAVTAEVESGYSKEMMSNIDTGSEPFIRLVLRGDKYVNDPHCFHVLDYSTATCHQRI